MHPLLAGVRPHQGLDICAPLGSLVRNWWGGTLLDVLRDSRCGNGLFIRSGADEHMDCHLAGRVEGHTYRSGSILLRRDQALRTGQAIGHVGLSGATMGPHLHWGVRYRDRWLDPAAILGPWPRIVAIGSHLGVGLLMLDSLPNDAPGPPLCLPAPLPARCDPDPNPSQQRCR